MLSDTDARRLLDILKELLNAKPIVFPLMQDYITMEAISPETKDRFQIDVQRKTLNVKKCTYQTRYKKSIHLLRLDIEQV